MPSWSWFAIQPQIRKISTSWGGGFPEFDHMYSNKWRSVSVLWMADQVKMDLQWADQPMTSSLRRAELTMGRVN
jgi:hypothetical protein